MIKNINETLKINMNNLNAYSTGLLQGKAYRALNTSLTKALLSYDITIPEWKLIGQLQDHGTMRLADLAERLNVEAPLVTALIDALERKNFVKRTNHPNDKRAKIITITKKGCDLVLAIEPHVKAAMNELLNGVPREKVLIYLEVLQTIVNNAS